MLDPICDFRVGRPTIGPVKQTIKLKIAIIFLPISLNICFECSKEPSHRDDSFEYPQHMFWLRNKKNKFQVRTLITLVILLFV